MFRITRKEQLDLGYELFIAAVSALSVFNLVLIYFPRIDPDSVNVVYAINLVLTLLFIYDFSLRFATAPSRKDYFIHNFGWADLLAIVPVFRIFRLFRIYKAYRIVKKYGPSYILKYLSHHRAESALYILVLAVILIIEIGAILVLQMENASPDANITTAGDAIWWAYVTITTVGYGDQYPVTFGGRIVGILVMTMGVAVFATFAGFISSKLLAPGAEEETPEELPEGEATLSAQITKLQGLLAEREKIEAEITLQLRQLDRMLEQGGQTGLGSPGQE
ncbi:voltage-gated potassium channel [Methanolinea mesophila]|uniref:ion transporter n=1 Tax=Methanolinea mesophila TaxID=547055 RepID=UPI001AE33C1A|nr:ion transporter [Methanolinea mesophila]MBP1927790.1 voltage-gated potassium channel [Methanolinea mesophila]